MPLPRRSLFAFTFPLAGCLRSNLPDYGTVPPFRLIDQSGQPFDSGRRLAGMTWVAAFIFTTCNGPCPRMTAQMRKVQDATSGMEDVRLVSFSIDPATDTPARLAEYAARFKANPSRWSFLTGEESVIRALGVDTFHLADPHEKLAHSSRFALVDRKSRIRGYYYTALAGAVEEVVAGIQTVRREWL
ncbi:MAG: SCO family protein [Bryobacteraceae bacterium]|nr:SCO family protein [Bryobacteraceae bacterium]